MSLLNQPPPPPDKSAFEVERLKSDRRAVLIGCAVVAFGFGLFTAPRVSFPLVIASALGVTVAFLLLPAVVGLIASRMSEKWHYAFAIAFAAVFVLVLAGRLAGR